MTKDIETAVAQKEMVEDLLFHLDTIVSIYERVATWNEMDFSAWLDKDQQLNL